MTQSTPNDSFTELLAIMAKLRGADGCQWDRQQTPDSLKPHILEEAYELIDAVSSGNPLDICDELGDLLLQVVFQAQIFSESGHFTMDDVARAICDKLIRRHPHIFSTASPSGHEQRWEEIKLKERTVGGKSNKLAARIPKHLPALQRATKVARKSPGRSISDLKKEIILLLDQIPAQADKHSPELQIGQILYCVTQLAAELGVDAEVTLRETTTELIAKIDSLDELL